MAGLGAGPGAGSGVGLDLAPGADQAAAISSRRHFATIAWLRWRIFVNSMRGKGATGELVAKFLTYPFLALMVLGPSVLAGYGSYYFVSKGKVHLLAIPLWLIFALWQFIGVNSSTTAPSFDLSSLVRFPIRYRDYLLIRLSFGLMDPPTIAGIACLISAGIGIGIAAPSLYPWAALTLIAYALCNILFSRMVYSWLERWLAQRRTRELVTGIILAVSLGAQFLAQFAQRLTHPGHHQPPSPLLLHAAHIGLLINWLLPPGLAASSIDHMVRGYTLIAAAALGGVFAYSAGFLLVLHLRLHAEYVGEDLSESPASTPKSALKIKANRSEAADAGPSFAFLPAAVAACLVKEIRYLLRSGPKLYVLIMPVFIIFLFSMRTSSLNYAGVSNQKLTGMLFCYGCAYTQLIFVGLLYNSLGADGAGVQFYFLSPVRMRDVMLAKNLLTCGIFALEAVLLYATSAFIATPAPLDLAIATIAWSIFTLFVNMSFGNVRSILSPKVFDSARMRSQNVSGLSSMVSLLVVGASVILGVVSVVLCRYFHIGYWIPAIVFLVLAALAAAVYTLVLNNMDKVALNNVENLTRVLSKI
jgi:ABC-2 type transport system permease protein